MASKWTQGKGSAKFGPTGSLVEYGSAISDLRFKSTRNEVTIPASFATGGTVSEIDTEAGAVQHEITIEFMSELAAAGFFSELEDAIDSASGELDFDVVFDSTVAVSVNNRRRTGKISVTAVEIGGKVGDIRSQSQTYKIKAGTFVKANT